RAQLETHSDRGVGRPLGCQQRRHESRAADARAEHAIRDEHAAGVFSAHRTTEQQHAHRCLEPPVGGLDIDQPGRSRDRRDAHGLVEETGIDETPQPVSGPH
ncbi:MAG: hypothetical protein ACK56F_14935, partial [bacterium]